MKIFLLLAALFVLPAMHSARGDLLVRFEIDPDVALLHETASVFIRIRNDSSYPLELGPDGPARLRLSVVMTDGRVVRRINQRPFFSQRKILPDEQTDIMFDVTRFFDFSEEGRYRLEMQIEWNERVYTASARVLEVVRGIEITSIRRTVPGYFNVDRNFTLRYWRRDGSEKLFLVVEDPARGTIQGVFGLGRLMRVFSPQINADRHGNVVVVHQSAPNRFTRTQLKSSGEGVSLVDQSYFATREEAFRGRRNMVEPEQDEAPPPEQAPARSRRFGRS